MATAESKPGAAAGGATASGASQNVQQFYQLYRRSSLGIALFEALDELIQSGHINPQLAMRVLNQDTRKFDKSLSVTFTNQLRTKTSAKGHLATYRLCDEVWTFVLKNAVFKLENNAETLGPLPGKTKIVACKASTADAASK